MTIVIALALLVVCDVTLAGFRASAGRDGRIGKRRDHHRALARGFAAGVGVVAVNAVVAAALVLGAADEAAAWEALVAAGEDAAWVFGAFAAVTLAAIALWFVPVAEVRLVPTLVILGPLTLIRPLVIVGGLAFAAVRAADVRVWIAAGAAAASMLAIEGALGRAYAQRWRRLL